MVLYYILFAVFWAVSGAVDPMAAKIGGGGAHTLLPELFAWLIAGLAFAVYDVASHSRHGRTLGKRLLRIELAPVAGGVLTTVSLAKRAALLPGPMTAMGIPALNLLAGVFLFAIGLFILIDKPLQQGLHDTVVGTWVVKRGR